MSYEADLKAILGPLVGGRCYPEVFPQPPTQPVWPAIRYTFIDNVPVQDICGDGDDSTATPRIQLDVVSAYSRGYAENRALRLQVMQAMKGFPVPARVELSNSGPFDVETQTYRSILDYSLHGST